MANRTFQYHTSLEETHGRSVSATSNSELKQWCLAVCFVVFGLVALFSFLLMGGIFALLGPWVILAGTLAATKRLRW